MRKQRRSRQGVIGVTCSGVDSCVTWGCRHWAGFPEDGHKVDRYDVLNWGQKIVIKNTSWWTQWRTHVFGEAWWYREKLGHQGKHCFWLGDTWEQDLPHCWPWEWCSQRDGTTASTTWCCVSRSVCKHLLEDSGESIHGSGEDSQREPPFPGSEGGSGPSSRITAVIYAGGDLEASRMASVGENTGVSYELLLPAVRGAEPDSGRTIHCP